MRFVNLFIILLSLTSFSSCANAEENSSKKITYELADYNVDKAILYQVQGSKTTAVDSTTSNNNVFEFNEIQDYEVGIYRIVFTDTVYTEIIINNENIHIKASANDLLGSVEVIESQENKILFDYWKYAMDIRADLQVLRMQRQNEINKGNNISNKTLKEIDNKIFELNNKLEKYSSEKREEYPDLFAPVLLRAYQMPSYQKHVKKEGKDAIPEERTFYILHFFDNIDFSDERLVNTKVLYVSINDYIRTFANPPTTTILIDIVDRLNKKASANEEVYRYVINLLMDNFEYSVWEKVYSHTLKLASESEHFTKAERDMYKEKLNTIERLQFGNLAPNLNLQNFDGEKIDLHKIDAQLKLVLFYSSQCEECSKILPEIKEVYDSYKSKGFVVYCIAIEDNKGIWEEYINKFDMDWINVADLKGFSSEVLDKYNIWKTPMMYLLDSENKIVAKPNTAEDLYSKIIARGIK
jgi:peroxiredoxin